MNPGKVFTRKQKKSCGSTWITLQIEKMVNHLFSRDEDRLIDCLPMRILSTGHVTISIRGVEPISPGEESH